MSVQSNLKHLSFLALVRLLISHRNIRNKILNVIDSKSYTRLVEENLQNRPRRVQQDKHEYLMALLHSFDRAIEHELVPGNGLDRFLSIFFGNVLLSKAPEKAALSLGFGPPSFLLISPTGKCNLRCTGCYAASDPGNHASLDFETFDRILTGKKELLGSHFTVISGGEPFMWRDGEWGLLDMVARHPSQLFMVYTNSTLITDDVAKRMAELGNITPAISVEGFEQETDARRGKGVHRRILAAFDNLRKRGVPFGLSVTPTRKNWETVTSDRFVDFYFEQQGAVYGWLFQYMPIGRGHSLDLMVTPEQRLKMLDRLQYFIRERKIFLGDFWNSGMASNGCICAGRQGGYFYIDWNGDISPCAFVPYSTDNIYRIYAGGGTINTAFESPLFKHVRAWQDRYGYTQPPEKTGNWLCPCVIRDHFDVLKESVLLSEAKPINEEAAIAIKDKAYGRGMVQYGKKYKSMTDPVWAEQYIG